LCFVDPGLITLIDFVFVRVVEGGSSTVVFDRLELLKPSHSLSGLAVEFFSRRSRRPHAQARHNTDKKVSGDS
jgi:hypothetical protein